VEPENTLAVKAPAHTHTLHTLITHTHFTHTLHTHISYTHYTHSFHTHISQRHFRSQTYLCIVRRVCTHAAQGNRPFWAQTPSWAVGLALPSAVSVCFMQRQSRAFFSVPAFAPACLYRYGAREVRAAVQPHSYSKLFTHYSNLLTQYSKLLTQYSKLFTHYSKHSPHSLLKTRGCACNWGGGT